MLDISLLTVAGLLAAGSILTEEQLGTRLLIALSFGVLVALYWLVAMPYYERTSLEPEELDIFN